MADSSYNDPNDGGDESNVVDLPNVGHISVGDIFPYNASGISYGTVVEIDESRSHQFKISFPDPKGYLWLNATHYAPEGESKEILSDKTASDIFWRVDRYNGL